MYTQWQKKVKCALIMRDMDYEDLAKAVGTKNGYVRQLLCDGYGEMPNSAVKQKISEYLEVNE